MIRGKLTKHLFVSLCLVFSAVDSAAEERVNMAGIYLPNLIDSADEGVFIDVLKEVEKRTDVKFDIKIVPSSRRIALFNQKVVDGLFPFLELELKLLSAPTLFSEPFVYRDDVAFVRKGDPIPHEISDLYGLRIGLNKGYGYDPKLTGDPHMKIIWVTKDDSLYRMLSFGRIDAIVNDIQGGQATIESLGLENLHFDHTAVLFRSGASLVFRKTERLEMINKSVKNAILEMKNDRSLAKILQEDVPVQ